MQIGAESINVCVHAKTPRPKPLQFRVYVTSDLGGYMLRNSSPLPWHATITIAL